MIPYLLAILGGFLIGDSSKVTFAEGGDIESKWQIYMPSKDGYFSLDMKTSKPKFASSPDLGYQYSKEEAESMKEKLEKDGYEELEVVKYNKDWWKIS